MSPKTDTMVISKYLWLVVALLPTIAIGAESSAAVPATHPAVPHVRHVRTLSTTRGANLEFVDPAVHPDFVSATQLSLSVDARVGPGQLPLRLVSDPISEKAGSSCVGPCNLRTVERLSDGTERVSHEFINCAFTAQGDATCDLGITRFAQFGHVDAPVPLLWLVTMPDGEQNLRGIMRTRLTKDGALQYPAVVELRGHMIITVKIGDGDPVRLLSRKEPVFRGTTPGWPPRGAVGELVNGPIEYYLDSQVDDPKALPFMVALANTVRLGQKPSEFFSATPQIEHIRRLTDGGVELTWKGGPPSSDAPHIVRYHIYRNRAPGNLETWEKIATVPVAQTTCVDKAIDGTVAAEYAISHVADYPFGYEYEGNLSKPQRP